MDFEDDYLENRCFFDLVALDALSPDDSLEIVSRNRSGPGPYETDMIRRIHEAWRAPFGDLRCEQVRLLIGQKLGLRWLGRPAIEFATRYPAATITNYPGEMALLCLRATTELAEFAEPEFRFWLDSDFSWFDFVFRSDAELREEAKYLLAAARQALGKS